MPLMKKPTTNTDHQQCVKEWIASNEERFLRVDEQLRLFIGFFVKNLAFVSGLGRGFHPNNFSEHIDMWCLGLDDDTYFDYSCMIRSLYSTKSVHWSLTTGRMRVVLNVRRLLHAPNLYHRIDALEVGKEEVGKSEAIHAKVSPLVKQCLKDMQQYLRENSSDILAKYRGRSHFHESCIRKSWIEHCPKPYLSDEEQTEKNKRRESEVKDNCEVVDPNIKTILKIARDAFGILVSHLKGRCINHLMDVLDLCINYPSGDCLLPSEYWVEPLPLGQVKRIHSLATENVLYKEYLPDADEEVIERCRAVVSEIIRKVQCSAKKRCVKELKKQIANYKKRETIVACANAGQLSWMAHPGVKASEPGETDEKQSQGSRKSVSWAHPM